MTYQNYLKLGAIESTHKGKKVVTGFNSKDFRSFLETVHASEYDVGVIPPGYEHRADKIADLFYDDPTLDWLICWTNNISDPFQQLNIGDRIRILSR